MSLLNRNDLFIPEFCEKATIGGASYDVIASEMTADNQYTGYGLEANVDIVIDVWKGDFVYPAELPTIAEKITFRGQLFRLLKVIDGSSNETAKLFLVSLSSRR
jgi:hypothetical protein